jgi:hypothetical protein
MNRLLGTLFALATLVVIAFAILNIGDYSSMCFEPTASIANTPVEESVIIYDVVPLAEENEPIEGADSTAYETSPEDVI